MASFLLTDTILQFQLEMLIGSGGEAEVYKAFDKQLNSTIAIKKIPQSAFSDFDLYFEEARKLYTSRHHNVVPVNFACKDTSHIYLSMPYYKQGSIKSLTDLRFLTTREIIRYSLQFLSGVNNVHSRSLIHFDIKNENILISDSNQALISDFGLSQYMGKFGFAKNFGTTPIYAPPELFSQSKHNLKFDIYQAGIAIYRMCNGDKDFVQQVSQALERGGVKDDKFFIERLKNGEFPCRDCYLPHIPKRLRKVINKALEADPNNRYYSIVEMLNDLSEIEAANDWLYSTNGLDIEKWLKDIYTVTVTHKGKTGDIVALKNGRRCSEHTKTFSTIQEKKSLLYKCLNKDW